MFDFASNKTVTDLETVPQEFQAFYKEVEGEGFTLDTENPIVTGAVSAITGQSTALKASRAEAKALKGKAVDIAPLKNLGVEGDSVEEIAAGLKAQFEDLQGQIKGGQEARVNIDKMKADIAKGHATEIEARDTRNKALEGQLYNVLAKNEALGALADSGVIDADLMMPHVRKHIKPVEEDGQFKVLVVDDAGDRKYSGATGTDMTIRELVKEMKTSDKYSPLFKSEKKVGTGTPPGAPARLPTAPQMAPGDKPPVNKIADGLRARGS
jgi:hypothetical protein